MKKIFALFISLIYLSSTNLCFAAISNLYFLKNTNKNSVKPIVETEFQNNKFNLLKKDPYYGTTNSSFAVVILQQSGANCFYYFKSANDKKINKNILKKLKLQNVVYEQSFNDTYLNLFDTQAQKVLSNTEKTNYDFDNTQTKSNIKNVNLTVHTPTVLKGYVGQIAKGNTFKAYLQTPINTANASKGDMVNAVLSEDWVYMGSVIAPQGSVVSGVLTKVRHATAGSMNGRAVIAFNQIITCNNKVYNISTEAVDFAVTNDGKVGRSVKSVATGAAIGAVSGLLIALLFCGSNANYGSAAAIGAASGAGYGLVSSVAEKGIDAEIPIYTDLELILTKPLNVVIKY